MDDEVVRQPRFRFNLRTLLLLTAIIALVLWTVPASVNWYRWRLIRKEVDRNFIDLHATLGKPQVVYLSTGTRRFYFLSNQVIKWAPGESDAVLLVDGPVDAKSLYVLPPGKWAKSSDEMMEILRDNL